MIVSNNIEKLVSDAQQELLNLSEWMRINKRSPNPHKTEYMVIGHPCKMNALYMPGGLEINGSELNRVLKT